MKNEQFVWKLVVSSVFILISFLEDKDLLAGPPPGKGPTNQKSTMELNGTIDIVVVITLKGL